MDITINSKGTLKKVLISNQIDLENWGCNGAKTISDLWHELETGESEIQMSPLHRIVSVVQVRIRKNNKILIETLQLMRDGSIRVRNKPPSEKMKPGENYQEAAIRCLQEELAINPENITLHPETYICTKLSELSPSYPGLDSLYILHSIEATIIKIQDSSFWTREISTNHTDPVITHCWDWVAE